MTGLICSLNWEKIVKMTCTKQLSLFCLLQKIKSPKIYLNIAYKNLFIMTYSRHAQHTARGPNVARQSFQSGPQSLNLHIFGLIFDVNTM